LLHRAENLEGIFRKLINEQSCIQGNSSPQADRHHLIVMHEVTNHGTDRSQLSHVANETKAALGVEKRDAVADRLEAVQRRLDEHPEKMRQRRETVEHPFGTIKAKMGATHFVMKTLPRVASEMALHVLPTI
jgi:hypothetical protein